MRRLLACLTLLSTSVFALNPTMAAPAGLLRGYTPEHSAAELQWEQKFRAIPDPDRLRENMRHLSARPHHVGSPYDKANAEWLLAQLKSYGLDVQIEQFETLFPTPKSRKLELLGPNRFTAKLEEPAVAVDPTSNQKDEQLPTYNAFFARRRCDGALGLCKLRRAR
jgi:N-acetylated-alpha-linked acidic dipeptidase